MLTRIAIGLGLVVLLVLGFHLRSQDQQIDRLRADVTSLREQLAGVSERAAAPAASPFVPVPQPARANREPGEKPAPIEPAAPRVPVTQHEVARIESAVLSLLESDHPELREKLKAVVQEEQESAQHEQREQRRERWIARREARLAELAKETGISAEQQSTLLTILLGSRDQIAELMQSADTAESFNSARGKARALREQADTQIRELLSAEQYQAYKERFEDDDERGRGGARSDRAPGPR